MTSTGTAPTLSVTPPAPGTWVLDPTHSSAEFRVRHLVIAKVSGRFNDLAGEIHVGDGPQASSVTVEIAAASIDTGNEDRDAHLRSPDFLDVGSYPVLTFRSTAVRAVGAVDFELDGELTIRGITRPVTLAMSFGGVVTDPWGNDRAVFSAETRIDREDFGLTWNQALESGGVVVGKRVEIELEVEATRLTTA